MTKKPQARKKNRPRLRIFATVGVIAAILLSPQAAMNSKPELEILADDVVCGHGATVGALDPEQVFYLQARGLPRSEAEAMLLEAFAAEAIARVGEPEFAAILLATTRAWLARRAGAAR